MSPSIIERISLMLIGLTIALATSSALAHGSVVVSKLFQVCIRGVPGLVVDPKQGIDAVEGQISGNGGAFDFMISTNPNLPAAMNIKSGMNGLVLPQLSEEVAFIAESVGPLQMGIEGRPIGYGTEQLYAFVMEEKITSVGLVKHRIYVQLWSNAHPGNADLLKRVGNALYRCQ